MESFPLVSICIPTYKSSNYIIETLEHVVQQTYNNIELIIIDDCSPDETFSSIKKWAEHQKIPVNLSRNLQNLGVVKTCNLLLEKTKGKYFQMLGADDILLKNKISTQVQLLERVSADVQFVYSDVAVISHTGSVISKSYLKEHDYDPSNMPEGNIFNEVLKFNFIPSPSVLIKRSVIDEVGFYDENLIFEDLDLWLRILRKYKAAYIPSVTAQYRRLDFSLMHNAKSKTGILNSVLNCVVKYRGISAETDCLINKKIISISPVLYRYEHPMGKFWIKQRLRFDKGIKSWIYYFFSLINSRLLWGKK